jgi:hypothetical protein
MSGHGGAISGWSGAGQAYALCDVKDDACEAVFVEVDFLVVGDLTDGAEDVSLVSKRKGKNGERG